MEPAPTPTDSPPRWAEYQPVHQLVPALRNAKGHDKALIQRSMAEFGYVEPVVVDERTGRLLSGHGRTETLAEAEAAGLEPPEGVTVGAAGRWEVLVVRGVRSRDDAHAHAMGIALNRAGERGGWQADTLAEMLDELVGTPMWDAIGWTPDELDDLMGPVVLDPQATDAAHAEHVGRGAPAVPREVQGLREVGLMFQAEDHRRYLSALAQLKALYGEDAAPVVVLRAMEHAVDQGTGA